MAELVGQTLGHYRIVEEIGAGGMGVVYRAHDERLDRDVAIKVLPAEVAQNPERLARFEREAKLLASLSHQNIATLYGLEEHEARRFLVMELAQGETLSMKIRRGALRIDDALSVAHQVAEGLAAAHERGIIHRDLKPANVMLSPQGKVKILDFGLAKALRPEPDETRFTESPTLTGEMTAAGVLVGTLAYMSPEQARGRPLDRRADVWAFGCILYELLTGRSLVEGDIDLGSLPPDLPPPVRRLLSRCLSRDPARRLRDLGDAILELDEPGAELAPPPTSRGISLHLLGWALAFVAGVLAAVLGMRLRDPAGESEIITAEIEPPAGTEFVFHGDIGSPPVISPDGSMVAFGGAAPGEVVSLWVRSLRTGETRELPGTQGGFAPFWSPDGRSIGFFDYIALKRVDVAGGRPLAVCSASIARGGTWTDRDTIIFAPDYNSGLYWIPATGGEPRQLTDPIEGRHTSHRWPVLLPDGNHVLYLAISHASPLSGDNELRLVGVDGSDDRPLVRSLANGAVIDGRLLFMREQTLLGQRLSGRRPSLSGEPAIIAREVFHDPDTWRGAFAAHGDTLLYQTSPPEPGTRLTLFDLDGKEIATVGDPAAYGSINASPDGRSVAVSVGSPSDIWVVDLDTGMGTRLTFGPASATSPVWSADGTEVFYRSYDAESPSRILAKQSSGAGDPRIVLDDPNLLQQPAAASPDGQFLVLEDAFYTPGSDILVMDLEGRRPPQPLIEREGTQTQPSLSPDGRWITYRSDESGGMRVYLEPFEPAPPETGQPRRSGRWEIPTDPTSSLVRWNSAQTEVLHLTVDRRLVAVDFHASGDTVRIGAARDVCRTNAASTLRAWDVIPGSDRVVVINKAARARIPITVVVGLQQLLAEAGQ